MKLDFIKQPIQKNTNPNQMTYTKEENKALNMEIKEMMAKQAVKIVDLF